VALSEHWASTRWLCRLDDEQLLRTIGATLGHEVAEELAVYPDEGFEVRGAEVRAIDIGGFVSRRLHDLDRVVGAAFGAAGSRLNTHFRTSLLPGITQFVGDILVYQRHREAIGDRVRRVIDGVEPGLGRTPDNPVDILAHSLGGVIAFDLAASEDPLWVRRLITFGSQPSFFHVSDPRGGTLDAYSGTPVQLPQSIGTWTNLWEPLDPLAFVVARVFRLHHGSLPDDKKVSHLASSGVWTHSGYWGLADVAREIRDALA